MRTVACECGLSFWRAESKGMWILSHCRGWLLYWLYITQMWGMPHRYTFLPFKLFISLKKNFSRLNKHAKHIKCYISAERKLNCMMHCCSLETISKQPADPQFHKCGAMQIWCDAHSKPYTVNKINHADFHFHVCQMLPLLSLIQGALFKLICFIWRLS